MKVFPQEKVILEKVVGGGQTIGTLADGRRVFVWGGVPGEEVIVQLTKRKKNYAEAVATEVTLPSPQRVAPEDPESYLSTSPWQIYSFAAEQQYKAELISEAFALHNLQLPHQVEIKTNQQQYHYRNKVEFSFWWHTDSDSLDLAFFKRGGNGKVPVHSTSLAHPAITAAAERIIAQLGQKHSQARSLKTLLLRCTQAGEVVAQLYVKDEAVAQDFTPADILAWQVSGGEVIYSDHRSPASVITKRYAQAGNLWLEDTILSIPFRYAAESFFQVNIPLYELALRDMQQFIPNGPVIDIYSGVGSIGLTIGGDQLTLVESNNAAVQEMKRNVQALKSSAKVIHTPAEQATNAITGEATIILDPPRAGLHQAVIDRLLAVKPKRIIYLSCNPVTQARDVALLHEQYAITAHTGYNFFPRTPHIEHLAVLELR
ncbi:MAG TPA: RsmD family RNA methyltransferase [Verrucomicrobiae bacterium]|nr:RsmD family RNA methyltransferase [Verrucomicrobiae bacterium]